MFFARNAIALRRQCAVNYYEHHIGDYAAATAHLTLVEDAVYTRMMRRYYLTEQPLPTDVAIIARLVGARAPSEIDAVQAVLDEFFVMESDGYHQKRCDEDIAKFIEKQAKARASAAARWGNADRIANALPTHTEGNAHQTPDTKHQKAKKRPSPSATVLPDPPDFVNADAWTGFVAMRARIRHPLTARAASLIHALLTKFRDAGQNPNDILDNSTRNGWRDVFAPRDGDTHAGNQRGSGRKLSAVEQVEHAIHERRAGESRAPVD